MEALKTIELGAVTIHIYPDNDADQECPITEAYGTNGRGAGLEAEGIIFASFERRSTLADCHRFDSPDDVLAELQRLSAPTAAAATEACTP